MARSIVWLKSVYMSCEKGTQNMLFGKVKLFWVQFKARLKVLGGTNLRDFYGERLPPLTNLILGLVCE